MKIKLSGQLVDAQTRCVHYHSQTDVVAIKFKCCQTYYPCYLCHKAEADHPSVTWSREEFDELAVYCGICKSEISINDYLGSNNTCPQCNAAFNPNCSKHYSLYFSEK